MFRQTRAAIGSLLVVTSANETVPGSSCSKVHTNRCCPFSHRSAGNGSHATWKPPSTFSVGPSCTGIPPALRWATPYAEPAMHRSFTSSRIRR